MNLNAGISKEPMKCITYSQIDCRNTRESKKMKNVGMKKRQTICRRVLIILQYRITCNSMKTNLQI